MTIFQLARGVASFVVLALLTAFIGVNVRTWAAAKGWDNLILRAWDWAAAYGRGHLPRLNEILAMVWAGKWWFWLSLGLSGGVAAALWAVSLSPPPATTDLAPLRTEVAQLKAELGSVTRQRDDAIRQAGLPPAPPPQQAKLSPEESRAKILIWKNLERLIGDLEAVLNQGDEMLDTWVSDFQTSRANAVGKAQQFERSAQNIRLKLESTHHALAGDDSDISHLLDKSVRPPGSGPVPGSIFDQLMKAANDFVNGESSISPNVAPSDLPDEMGQQVYLLRAKLKAVRVWAEQIKQTATAQRADLESQTN